MNATNEFETISAESAVDRMAQMSLEEFQVDGACNGCGRLKTHNAPCLRCEETVYEEARRNREILNERN